MSEDRIENWRFFCALLFIAWVSLVPEPWQQEYNLQVKSLLGVALLISILGHRLAVKKYFFRRADIFFWLYAGGVFFTIWYAAHRGIALRVYSDITISAFFIYFLLANEMSPKNILRILRVLCACAGLVSLFGIAEMLTRSNLLYTRMLSNIYYQRFIIEGRMMSTLAHPNILGAYLVSCAPIAYYCYKNQSQGWPKLAYWANFWLILAALFLSYSRGSWLAFVVMLIFALILQKKLTFARSMFMAGLILAMLAYIALSRQTSFYGWGNLIFWDPLGLGHRMTSYLSAIEMIKKHPFVGVGMGNFREIFNHYSPYRVAYEVRIPDSVYLMYLAETGIIGFTGFVVFLGGLVNKAKVYYNTTSAYAQASFALLVGFAGLLANLASFDGFLWKTPLYLFWIFAGLIAGITRVEEG